MYECFIRFKDFKVQGMINKIKYQKVVVKNFIVICFVLLVDWVDLFVKFLVRKEILNYNYKQICGLFLFVYCQRCESLLGFDMDQI